ncbi:transposable element Tcb1 transposase [Trichonephila clavipes]|nr:transposable element Tcb1 transposase [Trichonephila clavipes]
MQHPEASMQMKIGSRVGRNQTTVMRICDRWIQEGTTDRRGRSHPPQCTTSRDDRQIVRMVVTDRLVTSRTVAQHIESVTHHSVFAPPRWSDSSRETPRREDTEQLSYAPQHWSCTGYYGMGWYCMSLSPSSSTHYRYFNQPALHLRGVGVSCPSSSSRLGQSHISTG